MKLDNMHNSAYPFGLYGNGIPSSQVQAPGTAYPKTGQDAQGQTAGKEESPVIVIIGNRDESLAGLGNIGGIQSGIMRRAVSNMQKDSVLHEYQYFVGSGVVKNADNFDKGPGVITSDEDGVVIRK